MFFFFYTIYNSCCQTPFGQTSQNCNSVYVQVVDPINGDFLTGGGNAETLPQLVTSEQNSTSALNMIQLGDNFAVALINNTNKTAQYYNTATGTLLGSGNWYSETVNTEAIYRLEIPPSLVLFTWNGENEERHTIFSVHDGYVRKGVMQKSGETNAGGSYHFNQTAMDALKSELLGNI